MFLASEKMSGALLLFCFMVIGGFWCSPQNLSLVLVHVVEVFSWYFCLSKHHNVVSVDSKNSEAEMPSNPTSALYQWKWWTSRKDERNRC